MRLGVIVVMAVAGSLTVAGCHKQAQPQQQNNLAMEDDLTNGAMPANADIETLPPDESSETPSNQLANGLDNPDVNDVTTNGD